jgi:hypothetical protein
MDAEQRRRLGLVLTIAALGASMLVLLRAGFWIAGDRAPPELSDGLVVLAALVLVATIAGAIALGRASRRRAAQALADVNAAMADAPLVAPRPRLPMPTLVDREPPPAGAEPLLTCVHLQALETAMRAAGCVLHPGYGRRARADCRIDEPALIARFGAEVMTTYVEVHEIDRSIHDPKAGYFRCDLCDASLGIVHPEQARAATPWFPP